MKKILLVVFYCFLCFVPKQRITPIYWQLVLTFPILRYNPLKYQYDISLLNGFLLLSYSTYLPSVHRDNRTHCIFWLPFPFSSLSVPGYRRTASEDMRCIPFCHWINQAWFLSCSIPLPFQTHLRFRNKHSDVNI